MTKQIPFDIIEDPIDYKGNHIQNGYQLDLSGKVEFNNIEMGNSPFFVTTKAHNFINDPVMIYTFFICSNNELSLESEPLSSAGWIREANLPFKTGFIWPNIDSYLMQGFQPNMLLVMEPFTNAKLIDPIMNIRFGTIKFLCSKLFHRK